jgi:hypothetical protein
MGRDGFGQIFEAQFTAAASGAADPALHRLRHADTDDRERDQECLHRDRIDGIVEQCSHRRMFIVLSPFVSTVFGRRIDPCLGYSSDSIVTVSASAEALTFLRASGIKAVLSSTRAPWQTEALIDGVLSHSLVRVTASDTPELLFEDVSADVTALHSAFLLVVAEVYPAVDPRVINIVRDLA